MCSDSFQLLGMAERGFLPAALATRSRHGTPTLAIVLSSVGILMLLSCDFLQVMHLASPLSPFVHVLTGWAPAFSRVPGFRLLALRVTNA